MGFESFRASYPIEIIAAITLGPNLAPLRTAAAAMHERGHAFLLSRNGVWPTKSVPAVYLSTAKRE